MGNLSDLAPIIGVVGFFQLVVLQQPLPDLFGLLVGLLLVLAGLTLFIWGLELGLFPLGEAMAHAFARKGSVFWLIVFAFALGFGTTVAEPALIAIAAEASEIARNLGRYITGNTDTPLTDVVQPLERSRQLTAGLLGAIGPVGSTFARKFARRFSPDDIRNDVRREFVFDAADLIFQRQFLFLQSTEPEWIGTMGFLKRGNRVVEITMLALKLCQFDLKHFVHLHLGCVIHQATS